MVDDPDAYLDVMVKIVATEIHTGGGYTLQGMTKLMWTNLEALLGIKHFFQFRGCDVSNSVSWAWAAGNGHQKSGWAWPMNGFSDCSLLKPQVDVAWNVS